MIQLRHFWVYIERILKSTYHSNVCTTIFNYCAIYNTKIQNQQIPVKTMDRENVVHVNNEILFAHKEEWNMAYLRKWMEQRQLCKAK